MAQTGYTPILIYASGTTGNTPSAANLTSSASGAELAINYFDGKLFYKDNAGVVQVLATKGTGSIGGSNTQVQYNSSGALAGSANLTFDGTTLTAAGLAGSLNGSVGATTPSTGAFTTLSASSTVSGTGFTNLFASPPAIGSTAANTGAFTTLTTSSTVTLNGGTANGVLYLNGSKVATSGSALTYNGSNTLTFDGGSSSYLIGPTGEMLIGEDGSGLYIGNGAGGLPAIPILFGSSATTFQRWFAGGSEQMRLTSTGLGIGTSSPGARLHSLATTNPAIFASSDATALFTTYQYNTSTVCGYIGNGAGVVTGAGASNFGVRAENSLVFAAGGNNERMRLDSSGNLGLGVTPSTWSLGKAFQVNSLDGAVVWGYAGAAQFGNNFYYNGGYLYATTAAASRYVQSGGAHQWFTAPSGTAGNAISFTQALTLDANGKLLVGLTSSRSTNAIVQANAPINLQGYTVATLPAGTVGDTAYVTDATAPTFLGTLTGGGTVKCPVFYNGTAWVAY